MIRTADVQKISMADATAGQFVLVMGSVPISQPAVIAQVGGRLAAVAIRGEAGDLWLQPEDTLLAIAEPEIRFDLASAIPLESRLPPTGSLMMHKEGLAVFIHPGNKPRGDAVWFSGKFGACYRGDDTPAFTRWQIGIRDGDAFVAITEIDVSSDLVTGVRGG